MTLKITTETIQIAKQEPTEVQMVEIPAIVPVPQKMRADVYLSQQLRQKENLKAQLEKVTANIAELEGAGIKPSTLPFNLPLNKPQ